MANKMLIDATHPEETRVVVVRGNRVEEFDYESASRKQLRGNIYLAKVTRVEPSLQAAFIEYGGNRHGFLAFSEIHPDYYQIPVADRQALIEEEERAARAAEDEEERRERRRERSRHKRAAAPEVEAADEEAEDSDVEEVEDEEVIDTIEDGTIISSFSDEEDDEDEDEDAEVEPLDPETLPRETDVAHIAAAEDGVEADAPVVSHAAESVAEAEPEAAAPEAPAEALPAPAEQPVQPEAETQVEAEQAAAAEVESKPMLASGDAVLSEPAEPAPATGSEAPEASEAADADEETAEAGASEADAAEGEAAEVEAEAEPVRAPREDRRRRRSRHRNRKPVEDETDGESEDGEEEDEGVEQMGSDDALEEVPERAPQRRARTYKIQEVIRRRQVMLVQVVKEERGNKGAALTTYLSLAGRYSVLMPNTARGGGISRKITNAVDRKRLKEVVQELEVPEGMGIILRTAGANRTKVEIKRDFEYLLRLWETVRELTLTSSAPNLVYEEGSLIKRAIRDLYSKEIDEIHVAGEEGFQEARDFMRMLMPSHAKNVIAYREPQPIFAKYGVEHQLDAMFSPVVQLKSGGYIVINPTEALVSIDVNSGRATREHHIEDTALKTNMEAAEEIARQLRLRDLAGLIVIDFIDMEEKRNNRSVERKLKDCLKNDRARIQVGRISHFGLMEMSRQRIRTGVLESSIEVCPVCGGTGHVRSAASVALQLLRALEEQLLRSASHNLIARTRGEVALYVLNHKRAHLRELEDRFSVTLIVQADESVTGHQPFLIEKGEIAAPPAPAPRLSSAVHPDSILPDEDYEDDEEELEESAEAEAEDESEGEAVASERGDDQPRKRRRRRRRRGGERESRADDANGSDEDGAEGDDETESASGEGDDEARAEGEDRSEADSAERRRRRRGRRGGRRNRREGEAGSGDETSADAEADGESAEGEGLESEGQEPARALSFPGQETFGEIEATSSEAPSHEASSHEPPVTADAPLPEPVVVPEVLAEAPAPAAEPEAPAAPAPRRRSTVREKAPVSGAASSAPAEAAPAPQAPAEPASEPVETAPESPVERAVAQAEEAPAVPAAPPAKPRTGWWQRKLFGE
ncbi:Rne/Rng family ribonuclease [Azorhizobium caulinodans]|uniref:Rne/Rng family ribonuclease n=4 Tax=Azorhizobium caulinodans TaxID=7 RepID=UPI002FBEFBCD